LGFANEYWLNDPHGLLKQVHPDDLSVTIEAYAHTYEYHAPHRCEYRLIGSDGKPRWFLDEANIVRDQQGEGLFLQGLLVDITKSKKTEQELYFYRQHLEELVAERTLQLEKQCASLKSAKDNLDSAFSGLRQTNSDLRASEQRFRLLLESAGEGILGLDASGCCTFVNRAALAMLGYMQKEILGQDIRVLLTHDCTSELGAFPEQSTACETIAHRCSGKFQRKDGHILPVECSSYPIEIDGQIDGTVLMFWDVTESQALIQQLSYQASHDPLTGLVNRTEFENASAGSWRALSKISPNMCCVIWIWITSNLSTTLAVTPPATSYSAHWVPSFRPSCVSAIPWQGWAATNLPCCLNTQSLNRR
jgi:diguanylate cyclase